MQRSRFDYDVVVIGAGHNGLVSAFYLARAGLKVGVFEARDQIGGACITEELIPGYSFSTCAGVCWKLQDRILDDMALERHGLRLHRLDPDPVVLHSGAVRIARWAEDARTTTEIRRLNPGDAERYAAWQDLWRRGADLAHAFFLSDPPTWDKLRSYAAERHEDELLDRLLRSSVAELCSEHFDDPRVQGSFINVDDVVDPWASGSAWVETYFHQETRSGGAFVAGGMGGLTAAMASAARSAGAEIHTSAEAVRLLLEDGRVGGVGLASGAEARAATVVCNADPKRMVRELLASLNGMSEYVQATNAQATEAAYLKFHGVMSQLPDISSYFPGEEAPHAGQLCIAPSLERFARARNQVAQGVPADEPIVYLHLPTQFDDSLARGPGHCVSAFIRYAPVKLAVGSWWERKTAVGEAFIDYVSEFVPNFRRDLRDWVLLTPEDIEQRVGLTDGSIHHLDMRPGQHLGERQVLGLGYGTPIGGLYLCGAGTHPGGEVTGAPGHNAAHAVLRGLRLPTRGRSTRRESS